MKYSIRLLDNKLAFFNDDELTELPPNATALSDEDWNNRHLIAMADEARTLRNQLLNASDFALLADSPFDALKKSEWIAYRADLRDLTNQPDFPMVIDWPQKPEA